jgi:riboflavin synthase
MRLVIDAPPVTAGLAVGASVAVDGVCLTAVEVEGTRLAVEVVPETLARTTLGRLRSGSVVNLERPLPADGRFDGHIVQGHVDGVGTVTAVEPEGDGVRMRIAVPPDLSRYLVEKGSVTVDGVSLTVAGRSDDEIQIALIPHTLEVTGLGLRRPGDGVNLEVDVIAKYVERLLEPHR